MKFRLHSPEQIFTAIYGRNEWENGSGPGSYPEATGDYRAFLENFMKWNNVKSVVDLGCGDWQSSSLMDWTNVDYIGIDCVRSLIEQNERCFGAPNIKFIHRDLLGREPFPEADLAIIKDVVQHWRFSDVHRMLSRIRHFKYVIFTNCRTIKNIDIHKTGPFHAIDMRLPPFSLPAVTLLEWFTKSTQLWIPSA